MVLDTVNESHHMEGNKHPFEYPHAPARIMATVKSSWGRTLNHKLVFLNSSLLFVLTSLLVTFLHEGGHAVAAWSLGIDASLHHNYVDTGDAPLTTAQTLVVTAAGPLVSLLTALAFHGLARRPVRNDLLALFFIYMAAFAWISFLGYLFIAPLFSGGDTGVIYSELDIPLLLALVVSALSILAIYYLLRSLSRSFAGLGTRDILEQRESRLRFANHLIKYPLAPGIGLGVLLNLPVPTLLSLIYPLFSPLALMLCFGNVLRPKFDVLAVRSEAGNLDRMSPLLIGAVAVAAIVDRLLVYGFAP